MTTGRGFALVVNAPDCPTCGATQQGRHYLELSDTETVLLYKAGMHTGHPANFWDGLPVDDAAKELYRLKTIMLKKPYEYMMLAREQRGDYGAYERLIFKIDHFVLEAPKNEAGIVSVSR